MRRWLLPAVGWRLHCIVPLLGFRSICGSPLVALEVGGGDCFGRDQLGVLFGADGDQAVALLKLEQCNRSGLHELRGHRAARRIVRPATNGEGAKAKVNDGEKPQGVMTSATEKPVTIPKVA